MRTTDAHKNRLQKRHALYLYIIIDVMASTRIKWLFSAKNTRDLYFSFLESRTH